MHFLAELYSPYGDDAMARAAKRLDAVAALRSVRFVRSVFVPEDETCFYLFEADALEAVLRVARQANLRFEHISEAVVHG
jgi:hypothetical protein